MTPDELEQWLLTPPTDRRVLIMGILNVTPDSFSDGGEFATVDQALRRAREMVRDGADLIDIGGESTRPGSLPTGESEQIRRVTPVISSIMNELGIACSIDTTRSAVAKVALKAGAAVVNDISAGRDDPEMLPLVASSGVPVVLMHMQGTPATMQEAPAYSDVSREVAFFLNQRVVAAERAGIAPHRILIDPGLGFGKTTEHNLTLLRDISGLARLGRPVLVGPSRTGFIRVVTGAIEMPDRVFGTAAAIAWCVANGTAMVRVHDVAVMSQVVRMIRAIQSCADTNSRA